MRQYIGKDSKYICIPAGSLASLTFCLYRNNTIALYVMLKTLQVHNYFINNYRFKLIKTFYFVNIITVFKKCFSYHS